MTKHETCAERIGCHLQSRLDSLKCYLGEFDCDDCEFDHERGVLVLTEIEVEVEIDDSDVYLEEEGGEEYDVESMFDDHEDQLRELARDRYFEWGLSFDFDDELGCYIYLLSWGGPSDEFRMYRNGRTEYVFKDWFDGAVRDVSDNPIVERMVDDFKELYHDTWNEKFDRFDEEHCSECKEHWDDCECLCDDDDEDYED